MPWGVWRLDQSNELARAVRTRRRSLGLTQGDVADLAGCSPRFVRALESGKHTVRLDKVWDVLEVLGLELDVRRRGET
jgi:HTH-type transcriptional regulator/antitoxin HipB